MHTQRASRRGALNCEFSAREPADSR